MTGGRGSDRLSGAGGQDILIGQIGDDRLLGGEGVDQLYGDTGSDRVRGGSGNDSIIAGPGPDAIAAGAGSDGVLAGPGGDGVKAGPGEDVVLGGGGGDRIDGDQGDDRLFGELVDDEIYGGGGDDRLSGGHGVDDVHGGAGADVLRGDFNRDFHWGDAGSDTVSYATSTPPGPTPEVNGVVVDLRSDRALEDAQASTVGEDDPRELVEGIENVIGSNFDDELTGAGGGTARGLGGSETCSGFAGSDCDAAPLGAAVSLDAGGSDPGLLVRAGPGSESETFTLAATASAYTVTAASPISPGAGCSSAGAARVSCPRPKAALGYATVWGGGGADQLAIGGGFPETTTVLMDGGEGSDLLTGSSGAEILLAGPGGADRIAAGAGDDALISGPGSDVLQGGDGVDQLVTTHPCDGHDYSGGPGAGDIAGFGLTISAGIVAQIGGVAFQPGALGCRPTLIRDDLEILEGTQFGDTLYGSHRDDPLILGNEGNDVLYGLGGADVLRGERGHDSFYGGGGRDLLEAFDRARDRVLSCGPGGHRVVRDRRDPKAGSCRLAKHKSKPKPKVKKARTIR
ncbi:MAG: hypothetical protein M3O25_04280 [Actinomycetota bacterium]|nr:hypothetical protein [Actinomycetota bacterium]